MELYTTTAAIMFRVFIGLLIICTSLTIRGDVVDLPACSDGNLLLTAEVAKIYDNQTKGDIVYSYLDIFNQSLTLGSNCDGLEVKGSDIVLTMTNDELNRNCSLPRGECTVLCGRSKIKVSLFRSRVPMDREGPVFLKNSYAINVTENILKGTVVFSFQEHDIIRKDCFHPTDRTFSLPNIGVTAPFTIPLSNSGRIVLTRQLDYENGDRSFSLNVTLTNWNRVAMTTVNVNVIDVDDMDPIFQKDTYVLEVKENASNNSDWQRTVPEIYAYDRDTGTGKQDIVFSHYNNYSRGIIDINEITGRIKIIKTLDREEHSSYLFKIKVYQINDPRRSATANLNVIVSDENDNKPIFDQSKYIAAIDEHSGNGTFVLKVHATDKDTGNFSKVIYSILPDQTIFNIHKDSGVIVVNNQQDLDAENIANPFVIQIQATDANKRDFTDQAIVRISIIDRNDNSPTFTQNLYHLNSTTNVLGKITALDLDKDGNGKVVYSLEMAPAGVEVNRDTGDIISSVPLPNGANFRVKACDSPQITSSRRCAYADVHVSATASQATTTNMTTSVMENQPTGSMVAVIKVTGSRYQIKEKNVPFVIDSSGVLSTQSVLDFDDGKQLYEFDINVLKKDRSIISTVHMTVHVLDTNDNAPVFENSSYIFSLSDDASTAVGTVKASDKDSGRNGQISYSIETNLDSPGFTCDIHTGQIWIHNRDSRVRDLYQLFIKASDDGVPQLSSFVRVLITRVHAIGSNVKFGTPLEVTSLQGKTHDLESDIGSILNIKCTIEGSVGVPLSDAQQQTRSFLIMSGKYDNGSSVLVQNLRVLILEHMAEIQRLFGHNTTVHTQSFKREGLTAPVIALVIVGGVIFFGSIILILVLRSQWQKYYVKQLQFDRLNDNLTRKSSLYESQEIQVNMDEETSDYAGSLNTQDVETSHSSKRSPLDAAAFSNPVYHNVHGQTLVISPSTAAATNEALESLQDLAERLNIEDKTTGAENLDNNTSEQTCVKEAGGTRIVTSVETYEDVDFSTYNNFEIENSENEPEEDAANLMNFDSDTSLHNDKSENGDHIISDPETFDFEKAESNSSLHNQNSDNEEHEFSDPETFDMETAEPNIDYNDKQVRFSSTVLDTEDDVFKPLKEETITPAQFEYDSDRDDKDMESLASSFPDLYKLMKHDSDETDRADEEINSPIDFLKVDVIKRTPTDNGTFHFGITEDKKDEDTRF